MILYENKQLLECLVICRHEDKGPLHQPAALHPSEGLLQKRTSAMSLKAAAHQIKPQSLSHSHSSHQAFRQVNMGAAGLVCRLFRGSQESSQGAAAPPPPPPPPPDMACCDCCTYCTVLVLVLHDIHVPNTVASYRVQYSSRVRVRYLQYSTVVVITGRVRTIR